MSDAVQAGGDAPEVLFEKRGAVGLITLNRPKALNALTLGMVHHMHPQLRAWADDDAVKAVVVVGAGEKGFCAGGDIRALYDSGKAGTPYVIDFYRDEYRLNRYIKHYPKPYVAIIDGITMGGGVGVSVHGEFRVATERTLFAMPETGIGLFPDVGGSYFLPRLPGETGMYMALTGARIKAADAVHLGVATHYLPSGKIDALIDRIAETGDPGGALAAMSEDAGDAPIRAEEADINRLLSARSFDECFKSLSEDPSEWAAKVVETLRTKSPISVKVAFRQVREGAALDFDDCMRMEFRLTNRFMKGHDFYEGVRATIIDKDGAPKWQPARLEDVPEAVVESYFASLGADELTLPD